MTTVRTPNVFLVGAGSVASALAGALRLAGVPVLGLWARRPEAARQAASIAGVAAFSSALPDLLLEADVVIVAVRDDAIGEVAEMLVGTGLVTRRHVLLQCSGARPAAESFQAVTGRVAGLGTLHPLRSIALPSEASRTLAGTLFGVEGDAVGRTAAMELVHHLRGKPLDLDSGQMALYHAAAATASNCVVALLSAAAEILSKAGITKEQAMPALMPLVKATVDNVERVGVPRALTGPIARGDASTVRRHLQAISEHAAAHLPLYVAASTQAVKLARAKGDASDGDLRKIEQALAEARERSFSDPPAGEKPFVTE
ncbi:MAG: DUF2520 domain-containing protein [Deltaproteobacteria bacterium]|nr:DUF2520 domain-containing protein [Deltaproteobacteria bacterium]